MPRRTQAPSGAQSRRRIPRHGGRCAPRRALGWAMALSLRMIESLANIRRERYHSLFPLTVIAINDDRQHAYRHLFQAHRLESLARPARSDRRMNALHRGHYAIRKLVAPQLKIVLIFAHGTCAVNRYSIGRNPLKPVCLID